MAIIDAHQHLWDLDRFDYSWCSSVPALNRSFLPEDYAAAIAGTGITASIFVEADIDQPFLLAETSWVSELAALPGSPIAAIVAAARPEAEDFDRHLACLAEFPLVRGIRRVLHNVPDEVAQRSLFSTNLRKLPQYGFSFDLCVQPSQLPIALRLISACPETQFILDHCGNPRPLESLDVWKADLAQIAGHPNVVCKLSGIVVNCAPENWTPENLQPSVDHVLSVFGPGRILWGSDWPVCTLAASLKSWLDVAEQLTARLDKKSQDRIFCENAKQVYRLAI